MRPQYFWRINRITDPDEDARFEDKFGPIILVGMIIIVCSVAIVISINRFSWGMVTHRVSHGQNSGGQGAAGPAPAQGSVIMYGQQQQQQQQQSPGPGPGPQQQKRQQQQDLVQPALQAGDPKSNLMLLQTDSGPRLGPVLWSITLLSCGVVLAILIFSKHPLFAAFRRNLRRELRGERAGEDCEEEEDEGLLRGGMMGVVPRPASGYGSAAASSVPAFEAARPPPGAAAAAAAAAAVSVSGGGSFRRLPPANALQQRWDNIVATMLPDGPQRLHTATAQMPFGVV